MDTLILEIQKASSIETLAAIKTNAFGKQGALSSALRALASLPPEARKIEGERLNTLKKKALAALRKRQNELEIQAWEIRLSEEKIDVTFPPSFQREGRFHPLMFAMQEAVDLFLGMGFSVRTGPEIEKEYYNFDALNVGKDHPSRTSQDTFYFETVPYLLRTQTSPVQIRTLQSEEVPLQIVAPGRVYRSDHDRTHSPMFHQIEGLVVGEEVHMGQLKHTLETFLDLFFGKKIPIRFRPSFFPFTTPSAEVDILCRRHKGTLILGEGDEWLEVLGCGMVHPKVLIECGLDPEKVQGFAFGMGVERMAMLKYGIEDLRDFYQNDERWLSKIGFSCAL
jgi:phenylalanyl-tRNA synthetase alpha chain